MVNLGTLSTRNSLPASGFLTDKNTFRLLKRTERIHPCFPSFTLMENEARPGGAGVEGRTGDRERELTVGGLHVHKVELLFSQVDNLCLLDDQTAGHTRNLFRRPVRHWVDVHQNDL